MKPIKGSITLLAESYGNVTIEIHDQEVIKTFVRVTLTPEQFVSAMSRLAYTPCTIEIADLEKIGKKQECKTFEFYIDDGNRKWGKDLVEIAKIKVKEECPEGWEPDLYFSSQNSFFTRDSKCYGRTTIRRWV